MRYFNRLPFYALAVAGLLVAGAFLRLAGLDRYPLPMHQDELSNAYDAYSIVETGADRQGDRFPLVLRGVGAVDYRGSLYAWLAAVPIAIRGFSPATARLPAAIMGILSLLLVFLFATRLGGKTFALLALAFAALSPWHITYSRLAHEGGMLSAFSLILTMWLWQRAAARDYPTTAVALTGIVLGLSTSGYSGMRLVAPLIGLLILADLIRYSGNARRTAPAFIAASILGGLPQLIVLATAPERFLARFSATVTTSQADAGLIPSIASNVQYVVNPRILFWPNMEESGYLAARLLPVEILFYYAGILVLYRVVKPQLPRFRFYVYWAFLLAGVPALITWQSNSMRFGVIISVLPLWSAAGAMWIGRMLGKRRVRPPVYYGAISVGVAASFAFVAYMYLMSPLANGQRSTNVMVQLGERLGEWSPRFDRVYVVDSPYYAGLHVASFAGIHPREFQRTRRIEVDPDGWDYLREVGKFRFIKSRELPGSRLRAHERQARTLFVSPAAPAGTVVVDSVRWANDRYLLWIEQAR